ncbi:MAG: hypothetical protein H7Y02_01165, partial [Candidatus Obscuribacterales bacterium]|nr:hypothetical protein [Steroidobacteraceae bacterium]
MIRHISRLALVGAMLFPASLYALGLGEIHLNSALSQPFDAEIELLSPTADELSSLKVNMAGGELFSRYGLDRPAYLNNFVFKVTPLGDGRAVVRVSTNKAVTEPVVSILIEATWARGRILREYTLLLDPPVFVPNQSSQNEPVSEAPRPSVPPPTVESRNEGVVDRTPVPEPTQVTPPTTVPPPVVSDSTTPAPTADAVATAPVAPPPPITEAAPIQQDVPTPSVSVGNYDVQRNDSLWKIASQLRPGTPSEINQTMIALYRANPQAFV